MKAKCNFEKLGDLAIIISFYATCLVNEGLL